MPARANVKTDHRDDGEDAGDEGEVDKHEKALVAEARRLNERRKRRQQHRPHDDLEIHLHDPREDGVVHHEADEEPERERLNEAQKLPKPI